jgi:hypothetical protein
MTAGPTLAMLAAVRRAVYEIPFGGRAHFQYIADVALPFIHAVHTSSTDAIERNIGGPSEHVTDVIAALEVAAPEAAGTITFKHDVLPPLPEDMEASPDAATPLRQGVLETVGLSRRTSR